MSFLCANHPKLHESSDRISLMGRENLLRSPTRKTRVSHHGPIKYIVYYLSAQVIRSQTVGEVGARITTSAAFQQLDASIIDVHFKSTSMTNLSGPLQHSSIPTFPTPPIQPTSPAYLLDRLPSLCTFRRSLLHAQSRSKLSDLISLHHNSHSTEIVPRGREKRP